MKELKIWFDGGADPNPGRAYGSYEVDGDGTLKHRSIRQQFGEHLTNNQAEYLSLIAALKWLRHHVQHPKAVQKVVIYSDSMLVVKQLSKKWRIKVLHIRELVDEARALLSAYPRWEIWWHKRDNNVKRFGH